MKCGDEDPSGEEGDGRGDDDDGEHHGAPGVDLGGDAEQGQGRHEGGGDAAGHRDHAHAPPSQQSLLWTGLVTLPPEVQPNTPGQPKHD